MPDALTLLRRFSIDANRFDFFQAVRLIECAHPGLPRVGSSLRPREDAVRFGQEPELIFFPTTLRHFTATATGDTAPKLRRTDDAGRRRLAGAAARVSIERQPPRQPGVGAQRRPARRVRQGRG